MQSILTASALPLPSLLRGHTEALPAPTLLALSVVGAAAFGAAIGAYTGGMQILYAAVKMPLFFLATLGLSFAALYVIASSQFSLREILRVSCEAIALTAAALGGLAPVVAFAALSCTRPSQPAYLFLIVVLTLSVALGGIAGVVRLHARLASPRLTIAWVLIYQFTGAQMAWLLKPWVSHTFTADRFLPLRENLQGNFYEAVIGVVRNILS